MNETQNSTRRVAFITDQHFDVSSRWEETLRVHDFIATDARERGCTLTLLGGDLFERRSVAVERNAVGGWLRRMAELGPVLGVYGNHCAGGDLDLYNHLRTPHPVIFCSTPEVLEVAGVAVALLPWPNKANVLASCEAMGREQANMLAADALRNVLLGLGQQLAEHAAPRVFVGHCHVRSCRVSTGQPLAPGADFELGLEDLALVNADIYLLGHIHDGVDNEWKIGAATCLYGGSPRRTSFGELEAKTYTVATFENGRCVGIERVPTPCAEMILLTGFYDRSGGLQLTGMEQCTALRGAEIRLRYEVDADQREGAKAEAEAERDRLLSAGAVGVRLEERVNAVDTARAPEIATATGTEAKLDALWAAQNTRPDESRRARLLSKAHALETPTC